MIIFDMDGVIFEGDNFWLDLHKIYGTKKEALELADKYLYSNSEADYEYLSTYTANVLWRGKPASEYYSLIKERSYQPGVYELFDFIHQKNIRTAIISSGSYELALRAKQELGIDEIRANHLIVSDSKISGVSVMVPDNNKSRIGKDVMQKFKIKSKNVAFVGDTSSDTSLARIVGFPIAYNSQSEELNKASKCNLKYGELEKVKNFLSSENTFVDTLLPSS